MKMKGWRVRGRQGSDSPERIRRELEILNGGGSSSRRHHTRSRQSQNIASSSTKTRGHHRPSGTSRQKPLKHEASSEYSDESWARRERDIVGSQRHVTPEYRRQASARRYGTNSDYSVGSDEYYFDDMRHHATDHGQYKAQQHLKQNHLRRSTSQVRDFHSEAPRSNLRRKYYGDDYTSDDSATAPTRREHEGLYSNEREGDVIHSQRRSKSKVRRRDNPAHGYITSHEPTMGQYDDSNQQFRHDQRSTRPTLGRRHLHMVGHRSDMNGGLSRSRSTMPNIRYHKQYQYSMGHASASAASSRSTSSDSNTSSSGSWSRQNRMGSNWSDSVSSHGDPALYAFSASSSLVSFTKSDIKNDECQHELAISCKMSSASDESREPKHPATQSVEGARRVTPIYDSLVESRGESSSTPHRDEDSRASAPNSVKKSGTRCSNGSPSHTKSDKSGVHRTSSSFSTMTHASSVQASPILLHLPPTMAGHDLQERLQKLPKYRQVLEQEYSLCSDKMDRYDKLNSPKNNNMPEQAAEKLIQALEAMGYATNENGELDLQESTSALVTLERYEERIHGGHNDDGCRNNKNIERADSKTERGNDVASTISAAKSLHDLPVHEENANEDHDRVITKESVGLLVEQTTEGSKTVATKRAESDIQQTIVSSSMCSFFDESTISTKRTAELREQQKQWHTVQKTYKAENDRHVPHVTETNDLTDGPNRCRSVERTHTSASTLTTASSRDNRIEKQGIPEDGLSIGDQKQVSCEIDRSLNEKVDAESKCVDFGGEIPPSAIYGADLKSLISDISLSLPTNAAAGVRTDALPGVISEGGCSQFVDQFMLSCRLAFQPSSRPAAELISSGKQI